MIIERRYQTGWKRFLALWVDSFVVFVPLLLGEYLGNQLSSRAYWVVWEPLSYHIYWIYAAVLHARYGQTAGKKLLGVIVVDRSERRLLTGWQAFKRELPLVVVQATTSAVILALIFSGHVEFRKMLVMVLGILNFGAASWALLEIATMLSNDRRRAIHDYIAGSVVLRVNHCRFHR